MSKTVKATLFVFIKFRDRVISLEEIANVLGEEATELTPTEEFPSGKKSGFQWVKRLEAKEGEEHQAETQFWEKAYHLSTQLGCYFDGPKLNVCWH